MTQWFAIIQVTFLTLGLLLLLYYARFQSKLLNKEVMQGHKIRLPLLLKIYTVLIVFWFGFLVVEVFLTLF